MKLNEVIVDGTEFERFSEEIRKDCSDFISAYNVDAEHFAPLLRGEGGPEFGVREVNMNRRPVDSSEFTTFIFNAIIESEYGIANLRNKSIFCTHSMSLAESYAKGVNLGDRGGTVRLVFFPNGSKYFVSDGHHDSIRLLSDIEVEAKMFSKSPRWAAKFPGRGHGLTEIPPSISTIYHIANGEKWGEQFFKELIARTRKAVTDSVTPVGYKLVLNTDNDAEITVTGMDHYYSVELEYVLNFFNTYSVSNCFRKYITYLQGKGPLFNP